MCFSLKNGSKYNFMTKYNCICAYKSWKSVMIIKFTSSTNYIKLAELDIYNTHVRFTARWEL
jgi:hypothetical protein